MSLEDCLSRLEEMNDRLQEQEHICPICGQQIENAADTVCNKCKNREAINEK